MHRHPPVAAWSIAGAVASHATARGTAVVDLAQPARGIVRDHDALLGVVLTPPEAPTPRPTDHWLRANDLVAVYEPADDRRLRGTVMWRIHAEQPAVDCWEAVVSAQTSLLESDAAVAVVSDVAADELLWADGRIAPTTWRPTGAAADMPAAATCLLARRPNGTTALIAVHPADGGRIVVRRTGPQTRIECWLFSTTIEKGVLLRSRVVAAIGPDRDDTLWADRLFATFAASAPPLTT